MASCPKCGSGDREITVVDTGKATESLRLHGMSDEKIGRKPASEFDASIDDKQDKRYYRTREEDGTSVLQIVWRHMGAERKLATVHCKKCDNDWKLESRLSVHDKFLLGNGSGLTVVTCKQCGARWQF